MNNPILGAAIFALATTGAASAQNGKSTEQWERRDSTTWNEIRPPRSGHEETTVIGYDLDADGDSDVFYTISPEELDAMQRRMQDREALRRPQPDTFDRSDDSMWNGRPRPSDQRPPVARVLTLEEMPSKTVHGTVRQVREFELAGANEKRTFVRLETDGGERVVVNLGPTSELEDVKLRNGDQIAVRSKCGAVNNRMVLVADKLRIEDRIVDIDQPRIENLKRIRGEIVGRRLETFRGGDDQNLLVRIRDDNGVTHVVCLGSTSGLNANDVQEGDKIAVLAKPVLVNERQVYMAKRASIDGELQRLTPTRTANSDVRPHLRRTGQKSP